MPTALAPYSVTRNFARALHVIATTCLAGALVVMLGFQASRPGAGLWPAIVALVPMCIALFLADRYRRAVSSVLYLAVGGGCVYAFGSAVGAGLDPDVLSRSLTVELPAIALVMVGGIGTGVWSTLLWCTGGFVIGQVASTVALAQAGVPWRFDVLTTGAFGLVVVVLALARLNRYRVALTRPRFSTAVRDELVASLRYRLEVRAAALLHDTLLSHLAAVAATSSTLDPALAERMGRDLAAVTDDDWLQGSVVIDREPQQTDWSASPVHTAIGDACALGLDVVVTGDLSSLRRLDAERAGELGLAVAQCLVNVLQHAGTTEAEVAVYGSADEVLVMVVDTGAGFDPTRHGTDRLGIRHSVRGRLEAVDGSVQLWSTPGKGTSVVLRVPVGADSGTRVDESVERGAR